MLKLARAALEKHLPEIREEWPDEMLKGPADAAIPVLKEQLGKLFELAGKNPNTAVLALSLIPLFTGLASAASRAAARKREEAKQDTPGPTAADGSAES